MYILYIYIYIYILYIYWKRHLKISRFPPSITDPIFRKMVSLIVFRYKFYQNLGCGAHFQLNSHKLFEKVDRN